MRWLNRMGLAALGAAAIGGAALAEDVQPAAGWGRGGNTICPPQVLAPPCPPNWVPVAPQTAPAAPMNPATPPSPSPDGSLPPLPPGGDNASVPPLPSALADAPARGTGSGGSLFPTMYGDLPGSLTPGNLTIQVPGQQPVVLQRGSLFAPQVASLLPNGTIPRGTIFNFDVNTPQGQFVPANTPYPQTDPVNTAYIVPLLESQRSLSSQNSTVLALVARGNFKISENESPRPLNRIYGAYNFFYDVNSRTDPSQLMNIHREAVGFEKTFFDGRASFGMRQPGLQITGAPGIRSSGFGDLTMVFKYAFYNDPETRNLMSAGMNLTVPTGVNFQLAGSSAIDSVVFQPWLGGVYNRGDLYVHGFNSYAIPTTSSDVVLMFNDVGVGYFLFKNPDRMITYVAPTLEAHLTTPLSKRDVVTGLDIFSFTYGTTLGIGRQAWLNLGLNTPISGPRPYSLETIVQLNLGF